LKLLTTVIGALAAIGTTFAWLPQVLKTWRTRKADDFSWTYLAMFSAGVTGWLVYGLLKKDGVILAANATTLVLTLVIVWVKISARRET
jgi:MtN3 and saliva related transmembrane protein